MNTRREGSAHAQEPSSEPAPVSGLIAFLTCVNGYFFFTWVYFVLRREPLWLLKELVIQADLELDEKGTKEKNLLRRNY